MIRDLFSELLWGNQQNLSAILTFLGAVLAVIWYRTYEVYRAMCSLVTDRTRFLLRGTSRYKIIGKAVLLSVGMIGIALALLRPRYEVCKDNVLQEGRNLFIALDLSKSMLAEDCPTNRLSHAKNLIRSLLDRLSCERVGLILFSGSAFVYCPLTRDYKAFLMYLDTVDQYVIASGSTQVSGAVDCAVDAFSALQQCGSKLLVLITDGEDFSRDLEHSKKRAIDSNVTIYTIGVGTVTGAPIPLYNEQGHSTGHLKDTQGNVVITRCDEKALKALATSLGGEYISGRDVTDCCEAVAGCVVSHEKEVFGEERANTFDEYYHYFAFGGLVCLLLDFIW